MFKLLFCLFLSFGLQAQKPIELRPYELSLYSQNGEDGVLAKLFQLIAPASHSCVDIGASDGITMSNTYLLRLQGWDCLLLDRAHESLAHNLKKEFLTAENINQIFIKYSVPEELALLSLDVHYNDFHLWNALDERYRPAIVVIEYNASYGPDEDKVVKYRPFFSGGSTDYFGASILALYHLGRAKGYSLVYVEESGANLFFVRDEILEEKGLVFTQMNEIKKLYRPTSHLFAIDEGKNRIFNPSTVLIR